MMSRFWPLLSLLFRCVTVLWLIWLWRRERTWHIGLLSIAGLLLVGRQAVDVLSDPFGPFDAIVSAALLFSIIALSQLLTANRRDRDALHEVIHERQLFLAQMSHDLRSPLNVIIGYSDELIQETGRTLSAEQRRQLQKIHDSAQQLEMRIAQLPGFK